MNQHSITHRVPGSLPLPSTTFSASAILVVGRGLKIKRKKEMEFLDSQGALGILLCTGTRKGGLMSYYHWPGGVYFSPKQSWGYILIKTPLSPIWISHALCVPELYV